ncbi:hypothetical protein DFQ30_003828 [Apophysomyces sp. BC1015]|nr:hypothetical protein DFQ30_003828 [Apophysomyces sp. BC1015]
MPASPDGFSPLSPSPSSSGASSSIVSLRQSQSRSNSIRENVHVMIRCRPRTLKEQEMDEEPTWIMRPEDGIVELAQNNTAKQKIFQYDSVASGVHNSAVYNAGVRDLVRSTMGGYNGTVFAYGQTASGKTYVNNGTSQEPGVIPQAVTEIFAYIEEDPEREFMLRVSYLEIYNEQIRDLLAVEDKRPEIYEDKKRGVYVKDLREIIVTSPKSVMEIIKGGEDKRHISATDYNAVSSRSHTVFQMVIESKSKDIGIPTRGPVRVSQLSLIDLAGSEKMTSDTERRKEGAFINKSLLTLGTVISKLTSQGTSHIPFRDSKLTRILQTALSGNARISVICTINPTKASKEESMSTLRFAERVKLVKTAAKMTKGMDHSELQNCLKKIAELQSRMQEKTDEEVETRDRLHHLLGLILRSSKANPTVASMAIDLDKINPTALEKSTMREVVSQCEQGLAAQISIHQQMEKEMTEVKNSLIDAQRINERNTAKVTQYEKDIRDLTEQRKKLGIQLDVAQRADMAKLAQIKDQQGEIERMKSEISKLAAQHSKMDQSDYTVVLEEKDVELARLMEELDTTRKEKDDEIKELNMKLVGYQKRISDAEQEIERKSMTDSTPKADYDIEVLSAKLSEAQDVVLVERRRAQELYNWQYERSRDVAILNATMDTMQSVICEKDETIKELNERLKIMQDETTVKNARDENEPVSPNIPDEHSVQEPEEIMPTQEPLQDDIPWEHAKHHSKSSPQMNPITESEINSLALEYPHTDQPTPKPTSSFPPKPTSPYTEPCLTTPSQKDSTQNFPQDCCRTNTQEKPLPLTTYSSLPLDVPLLCINAWVLLGTIALYTLSV